MMRADVRKLRGSVVKGIFLGVLAVFVLEPAVAAPSGLDIMQQVYDQNRIHKNQQSTVEMRIYDRKDKVRKRWFKSKFRVFKDRSKSMLRIYRPTSQKGIGLLSESVDSKENSDQWIYLPAFRSVRKINSQNRNQSFLGSDLTISDMAGRKPNQDTHKLMRDDSDYWIVESRPKSSEDAYSRVVTDVHKASKVATRVEFYDREGRLLKTLENQRISNFNGMYVVVEALVSNARTGGRTELVRSKIDIKTKIGPNEVGLRGLEQK